MKLRVTKPTPSESLYGFLRRIADLNAYQHVGEFLSAFELPLGRPLVENLDTHALRLGVSAEDLREIAPSANSSRPALVWKFQRIGCDPFCPACIAEGAHWHASWRHCLVSACDRHRTRLQSLCPRCQAHLLPTIGGLRTCECGYPLAQFALVEAGAAECEIARLIGNDPGITTEQKPPFSTGVPSDVGAFLYFLATSQVEGHTAKSGKTPLPKTIDETIEFIRPAADVLDQWPNKFDELVREKLRAGQFVSNSAPELLGKWYQRLQRFRKPEYKAFRDRVGAIIATTFEGSYAGSMADQPTRTWKSAAAASREIGIRAERLVADVAVGRITGRQHRSGFGHTHTVIPADQIATIKLGRERFIGAKAAAEVLGIGKRQFALLCEAEVITEVVSPSRPPLTDGGYDSEALIELVALIRGACRKQGATGESIAFREINLRRTTDRTALCELFRKIAQGQVSSVCARESDLLGDFLFHEKDISKFLETTRHLRSYTALEVAQMTGWKHECITHWCRAGLLSSTLERRGNADANMIAPSALVEFQREYVVVADLARALDSSSRHLIRQIEQRGGKIIGAKHSGSVARCCLARSTDLFSL